MKLNRRVYLHDGASRKFVFERFDLWIVEFYDQYLVDFSGRNGPIITFTIKGGNFDLRQTIEVSKKETYQDVPLIKFPSTKLIIEFDEKFSQTSFHFNQMEACFTLRKIYCQLLLDKFFEPSVIDQMVMTIFDVNTKIRNLDQISQITKNLNGRWNEFPSLDKLASELKMHPVNISKYFSQSYGITLSEYMRKIKIERAVDMLLNTSESLAYIAYNCGFSDQSHMNRLVKKYIGYTPGTIRHIA